VKYYLNHVGYKVNKGIETKFFKSLYYLNHVGYKGEPCTCFPISMYEYYLNHVGYKVMCKGYIFI